MASIAIFDFNATIAMVLAVRAILRGRLDMLC